MQSRRLLATTGRGALAGGFTKDNLTEWAIREWGRKDSSIGGHYVDLLKHQISPQCAAMLESHRHPSSALTRALFQSTPFALERILVTTLGIGSSSNNNNILPTKFQPGDSYLFWTAKDVTPHEIILCWALGSSCGFTMLGVDPKLKMVYFGSGVRSSSYHQGFLFQKILIPCHLFYSNLLIKGMVAKLEELADKEVANNKNS